MPRRNISCCKCFECIDNGLAGCRYRQILSNVQELMLERKVLRESFADRAKQNSQVVKENPAQELAWLEKLLEMHHTGQDWLDAYERSKNFVIQRIEELRQRGK